MNECASKASGWHFAGSGPISLSRELLLLLLLLLLSVSQIGEWTVKCQVPLRDRFKFGVIYPVDLDTALQKLKYDINVQNDVQLANIERLKTRKNGKLLPSPTLKLAFNDDCLPVSIRIGIFSFRVRPYVFNLIQCYNCRLNNAVYTVVEVILGMTVWLKYHNVLDAIENIELTHVSALWYSMHRTLSS